MSTIALARPQSAACRIKAPQAAPAPGPGVPFMSAAEIPDVFAMRLSGDCLSPLLNDGDEVVFERAGRPEAGELCIFIMRPELVRPGGMQCIVKRLAMAIPPYVTFPWQENPRSEVHALVVAEQLNPPRQYMMKCESLLGVHRFVRTQRGQA